MVDKSEEESRADSQEESSAQTMGAYPSFLNLFNID